MVIALLYGGVSVEHVVSCRSAMTVGKKLKALGHQVVPIAIARDGRWSLYEEVSLETTFTPHRAVAIAPGGGLTLQGEPLKVDLAFPVTHGSGGEDGLLQGLLELAHIPYIGSPPLASSVGMHKCVTIEVVSSWWLPSLPSYLIKRGEPFSPQSIIANLGTSLIVKPDDGGSSVGVTPLLKSSEEALTGAVEKAFSFTNRVLVEPLVTNMVEVECAVIADKGGYLSSPPGLVRNPLKGDNFLTYHQKYLSSNQAYIEVPAPIGEEKLKEISELACMVAQALSVAGYARVDFFLEESGKVWFNEINTLPGLTDKSHFPVLAATIGYPWERLIPHLIEEALRVAASQRGLNLYGEE